MDSRVNLSSFNSCVGVCAIKETMERESPVFLRRKERAVENFVIGGERKRLVPRLIKHFSKETRNANFDLRDD